MNLVTDMKTLILLISLLPALLRAGEVTLAWDASPSTNVTAYRVYSWTGGTTNVLTTTGPAVIATVSNLTPGLTYSFFVTAVGDGLESDPSNIVTATIPRRPNPPVNLRLVEIKTVETWKLEKR